MSRNRISGRRWTRVFVPACVALLITAVAACGDDDATDAGQEGAAATGDARELVVTTAVLGDVATELVGDQFAVTTLMGPGTDPHEFQASAQQAAAIRDADALVVNGGGFEEGLADVLDAATADGVPTFTALDAVDALANDGHAEDDQAREEHDDHDDADHDEADHGDDDHEHGGAEDGHSEDEHSDDEHSADEHSDDAEAHDHDHGPTDPHFFTDPVRMADAATALVDFLAGLDGVDAEALRSDAQPYLDSLGDLDRDVAEELSTVPDEARRLVLNHDVFAYFADRYDFEIVGTVLNSASTSGSVSPSELEALGDEVASEGISVVFADAASSSDLVDTLADEVDVDVVTLFTESLGGADSDAATYLDMVRTNAQRIAEALG